MTEEGAGGPTGAGTRDAAPPSPGPSPRPIEAELKFRPRDLAAGERYLVAEEIGGFTAATPTRTTQLEDRYLDTDDGALARAGFAARLRQAANGTLVTVKSTSRADAGGSMHRREELEGPADRTHGPADWPPSDARSLILELCGDAPLVELVTIRQLRRKRGLRYGGTLVELSLDEVDVVVRSEIVDRFVELEVELQRGDERRLAELGEQLAADPALRVSTGSKLAAALAAARRQSGDGRRGRGRARRSIAIEGEEEPRQPEAEAGEAPEAPSPARPARPANDAAEPAPAKAEPAPAKPKATPQPAEATTPAKPPLAVGKTPGVTGDDVLAEAARKILRFHFARMLAREAGTRSGQDAEDLHSMRVATRRMRAAWRVFGDAFRPRRTKRVRSELRDVASRLGAVRDLDVLLDGLEAYRKELPKPERDAIEPLVASWRRQRDDARTLLARELDSPGYARFVDEFRVFVQTEGAGARALVAMQPHRIRDTMPSRIWGTYETVRAFEPTLRWADVTTLHELRIAAKWLRYTIEFVEEPLGPDAEPLVKRVTALQDHLGWLHDADVASAMARAFLVDHAGDLPSAESAAIGRYLLSRERELGRLRRTVGRPWRGVAGLGFRRSLGRVVAGL